MSIDIVTEHEAPAEVLTEEERVVLWRAESLERAGYGPEAVAMLALAREVDLHQAVDLLARCCPPETALRILL